mmetsp:Transcript_90889/g.261932  ORF Transcript_90889/g.261932 Transcript_90889/m.261932 type:complete len:345 (+) Transcript_90889:1187-2221(+)
MVVSCNCASCSLSELFPAMRTCAAFVSRTLPRNSSKKVRRCCTFSMRPFTSSSAEATLESELSASSMLPSMSSPPHTTRLRSCRLFCTAANCPSFSAATAGPGASVRSPPAAAAGAMLTQRSPSAHTKEPSSCKRPLKTPSVISVDTSPPPQISSSETSPQCQVMRASSMVQRGSPSKLPTHLPSKPRLLQTTLFNLAMTACMPSFIWGSANTSSAFSRKLSTMDFPSFASHSSQSCEAAPATSEACAVSRSCSRSKPKLPKVSRNRARVPAWILIKSAARPKKRQINGSVIAAGQETELGRKMAALAQGRSTTTWRTSTTLLSGAPSPASPCDTRTARQTPAP